MSKWWVLGSNPQTWWVQVNEEWCPEVILKSQRWMLASNPQTRWVRVNDESCLESHFQRHQQSTERPTVTFPAWNKMACESIWTLGIAHPQAKPTTPVWACVAAIQPQPSVVDFHSRAANRINGEAPPIEKYTFQQGRYCTVKLLHRETSHTASLHTAIFAQLIKRISCTETLFHSKLLHSETLSRGSSDCCVFAPKGTHFSVQNC